MIHTPTNEGFSTVAYRTVSLSFSFSLTSVTTNIASFSSSL